MGKYYQGYFRPKFPEKCWNLQRGLKPPFARSSWEFRMMRYLDENQNVIFWGSECLKIPYIAIDNTQHNYIPDFYCEIKDISGNIFKYLLEIKPKKQAPGFSDPPKEPKRRTEKSMARYLAESSTFYRNLSKWTQAEKFCQQNGIQFKIITEDQLGIA